MDFFDRQRYYKKRVLWLYVLFFVVIILHCAVGYVVGYHFFEIDDKEIKQFLKLLPFMMLAIFMLGYVIAHYKFKKGSQAVSKHLGAKAILIDNLNLWENIDGIYGTADNHKAFKVVADAIIANTPKELPKAYARYYEISEQMSIASGVAMPQLFVLPHVLSINSLVLGFDDDLIMIITEGALEKLDDTSLYGMIAYNYAKILHGDSAFNVEMLKVLGGLELLWVISMYFVGVKNSKAWFDKFFDNDKQAIEQHNYQDTGYPFMTYGSKYSNNYTHSYKSSKKSVHPAFLLVLLVVVVLISSAILCALFMRRIFCRSSVFLSDATSVQLTRSLGIGQALLATLDDELGAVVPKVFQYDYLFFTNPKKHRYGLFSAYPSIEKRLKMLENDAYGEQARLIVNSPVSDIVKS